MLDFYTMLRPISEWVHKFSFLMSVYDFDLETIVGRRSFLIKASTHEEWRHSKYYYVRIKSTVKIGSTTFYSGRSCKVEKYVRNNKR